MHHWLYYWVTGYSMISQALACSAWRRRLPFRYSIKHVPRVANKGPDSLSHHSVILAEDAGDLEASVHASVMSHSPIHWMTNPLKAIIWERVKEATRSDPTLQLRTPLYPHVSASFPPHKRKVPSEIPSYWDVCHNLSCIGDALVYGSWIVAPNSLCFEVLDALNSAHALGNHQSESSHPDLRVLAWHVHRYRQLLPTAFIVWCHYYHPPSFH